MYAGLRVKGLSSVLSLGQALLLKTFSVARPWKAGVRAIIWLIRPRVSEKFEPL